ncbi:MAG: sulfatase family protein [Puniceicoccales bacterium]
MKQGHPYTNLLIVFSDQHRWSDLGCYGNGEVRTPHFDAFAENGLRLDRCYSNCPLCVPARGTLLTGLHAMRHGAVANDLPVREDVESIGTVLKREGYKTGYVGKWHLAGVPRDQAVSAKRRLGFDYWKVRQCSHDYLHPEYYDEDNVRHEASGYEPVVQTDLALDFMRKNADSPWGLVLSWGPPHDPYDRVPNQYRNAFEAASLTLRKNVPEDIFHAPDYRIDREQIRQWLAGYYAHIMALDEQFGRITRFLKESGQWERTLVVYTSDHGDLLGSHGLTCKQMPYEESVRVPLIIGGGCDALCSGVSHELIGLVDLAPTLLGALGVAFQTQVDGYDLSGVLKGEEACGRDAVYTYSLIPCHHAALRGDCSWRALHTHKYTYAINADTGMDWLLFDNEHDRWQENNLLRSGARHPVVDELRSRLEAQVCCFDAMTPWRNLLDQYHMVETWNRSQAFFKLPLYANA